MILNEQPFAESDHETIHGVIADWAALEPDRIALCCGDQVCSYGELDLRARVVADSLLDLELVGRPIVAVVLEPSIDHVAVVLGVLKAGMTFLCVDPDYPAQRQQHMLDDSAASVLITRRSYGGELRPFAGRCFEVESDFQRAPSLRRFYPERSAHDRAFVVYTSGSSGLPKGVCGTHEGVLNRLEWFQRTVGFLPDDVACVRASPSFVISNWELFGPLTAGITAWLPGADGRDPARLLEGAAQRGVTHLGVIPTLLRLILEYHADRLRALESLRVIEIGGEPSPPGLIRELRTLLPEVTLVHRYGSSEMTAVICHRFLPGEDVPEVVPTGRPIDGTFCRILDDDLQPVTAGASGELFLGGKGLARGYLNDAEKTAASFIVADLGGGVAERMYRTGDLARWNADGEVELLGRADFQIKVAGVRIEPGEIEAALASDPAVAEAAVVAQDDDAGEARLVAFAVPRDGGRGIEAATLRRHLGRLLTPAMIPERIEALDALPRLPNGKVDRRTLMRYRPAMVEATGDPEGELDPLDRVLSRVLGPHFVEGKNGHSFTALGGSSLQAIRLVSALSASLGLAVDLLALLGARPLDEVLAQAAEVAVGDASPAGETVDGATVEDESGKPAAAFALTPAQRRMYFLWQADPTSSQYNVWRAWRLAGEVDSGRLEGALQELSARHPALRARIVVEAETPWITLAETPSWRLERQQTDSDLSDCVEQWANRPFDLLAGPLCRALLLDSPGERALVLSFHHLVVDAWSLDLLIAELSELYTEPPAAPTTAPSVEAYQRLVALHEGMIDALPRGWSDHWRNCLADLEPLPLPLPVAGEVGAGLDRRMAVHCRFPQPLTDDLVELCRRDEASLYTALVTAVQVLLSIVTQAEDVAVGGAFTNRTDGDSQRLVGLWVNTVVLRLDLSDDPDFSTCLRRTRAALLGALEHGAVPFDEVVRLLRPERRAGRNPLFDVLVDLREEGIRLFLPGVEVAPIQRTRRDTNLAMSFNFLRRGDELVLDLEYDGRLVPESAAKAVPGHLVELLQQVLRQPQRSASRLEILTSSERRRLESWSRPAQTGAESSTLVLERIVAHRGLATAVVDDAGEVDYATLERHWQAVAGALARRGVQPGDRIGLLLPAGTLQVTGLLAVFHLGAVAVPLDPRAPDDRIAQILEDAAIRCCLAELSDAASPALAGGAVVSPSRQIAREGAPVPRADVAPHDPAYVVFTSGTSGRPKGVVVSHAALATHLDAALLAYGVEAGDRVLSSAQVSSDLALEEVLGGLAAGATVVVLPPDQALLGTTMSRFMAAQRVTVASLSTAVWSLWLDSAPDLATLPALRRVIIGTEICSADDLQRWSESVGKRVALINAYGPTEATVTATAWKLDAGQAPRLANHGVPVGRPLLGSRVEVLDRRGRRCPPGFVGELAIAGPRLADGYSNQPAATAARFVPDPWGQQPGGRLYRTGDRARFLPDGNLEILGRLDRQVKLRGHRIELADIEANLAAQPGVSGAAVVLVGSGVHRRLVAFVAGDSSRLAADAVRSRAQEALPAAMVPAAVEVLEALPVANHGKIAYRELEALASAAPELEPAPRQPLTETQRIVRDIWAAVLELPPEQVTRGDDFFALGGHSLLVGAVVTRVRAELGVELPPSSLFSASTLGAFAHRVDAAGAPRPLSLGGPGYQEQGAGLASSAQRRLWFECQTAADTSAYHIVQRQRLRGRLDLRALSSACDRLVARHSSLRSCFSFVDDDLRAHLLPAPEKVLRLLGPDQGDVLDSDRLAPFDLSRDLPFRAVLLRLGDEVHVLQWTIHHIAADGESLEILNRELSILYRALTSGERVELPAISVNHEGYVAWQRQRLENGDLEHEKRYWRRRLEGLERLRLPRRSRAVGTTRGRASTVPIRIDGAVEEAAREVFGRHRATLFMGLVAAAQLVLSRWADSHDVAVGVVTSGRGAAGLDQTVGMLANTLLIRSDLSGDPTLGRVLEAARAGIVEALDHQELPFDEVVQELREGSGSDAGVPLDVVVSLQGERQPLAAFDAEVLPVAARHAKFELAFLFEETADGLHGRLEYDADLYDADTVERMSRHFALALGCFGTQEVHRLSEIELLTEEEGQRIVTLNDTAQQVDGEPLSERIARLAADQPDALAVVHGRDSLTYGELEERAHRLAQALGSRAVAPGAVVGVVLPRSLAYVWSLLAVAKAGAAWMALDPDQPPARLAMALEGAGAKALICRDDLAVKLSGELGVARLSPDATTSGASPKLPPTAADGLAYVVATSGTSGRPKLAEVTRAGLRNLVSWHRRAYRLEATDRTTLLANPGFDASVWEVWPTLASGATLDIVDDDLRLDVPRLVRWLADRRVTVSFMPTPLAEAAVRQAWPEETALRALLTGGDRLGSRPPGGLPFRLINHYGPAECTVVATAAEVPPAGADGPPPIGAPIDNLQVHVLGRDGRELPFGVIGELWIGGVGVGRGYRGQRDLTDGSFVTPEAVGERCYRSGDLVRRRSDGRLDFVGRGDAQINVRGIRIELGEVEAVLNASPRVRDCVCGLVRLGRSEQLVAWVVPEGTEQGDGSWLRELAEQKLPAYMVPAAVVLLTELPMTANGKVDRDGLPAPQRQRPTSRSEHSATERAVAGIWQKVLQVSRVELDEPFFELGGTSLDLARVQSLIQSELDHEISLVDLMKYTTVNQIAAHLGSAGDAARSARRGRRFRTPRPSRRRVRRSRRESAR
ncbi:MAG: amino acid adenylation domain-containing protein [Acidobacteriota bacterium]